MSQQAHHVQLARVGKERESMRLPKIEDDNGAIVFEAAKSGDVNQFNSVLKELEAETERADKKRILNQGFTEEKLTPLMVAIVEQHRELAKVIAKIEEVNVTLASSSGITPLLMASEQGWVDVMETLITHGAKLNFAPSGFKAEEAHIAGETPLFGAVAHDHPEAVALLLEKGADPDHQNIFGVSPLILAAEKGWLKCAQMLVEKGANLELTPSGPRAFDKNLSGVTALFCAAKDGHLEVVKYLLEKGADPNARNHYGLPVIWIPCQKGLRDVVEALLDAHADTELFPGGPEAERRNCSGLKPLDVAMENKQREVVKLLLERGSDPNYVSPHGWTPFWLACELGDLEISKLCLERGANVNFVPTEPRADEVNAGGQATVFTMTWRKALTTVLENSTKPNARNRYGVPPLLVAAENGYQDIVRLLLEAGADVNLARVGKAANEKWTPLIAAASKGHALVCEMLLDKGVSVNACTLTGASPLYLACESGHVETAKLLLDRGADIESVLGGAAAAKLTTAGQTPLFVACLHNHTEIIRLLLDRSANVNATNLMGSTPIITLCQHDNVEIVTLLLERGADIGAKELKNLGAEVNCLLIAAESGATKVVKLLLEKGMDPNYAVPGENAFAGHTALFCACSKGQVETARLLIEHGADVNTKEMEGVSCLQVAAMRGNLDIVKLLVAHGANMSYCFCNGEMDVTAYDLAVVQGFKDVADFLVMEELLHEIDK